MLAGDRDARQVGGLLLRELARGAAEAFAGQAAAALPTAFLAARDEDADVAVTWAEVWEEGTSSGAGAARLYACDIVPLIVRGAPGHRAFSHKICFLLRMAVRWEGSSAYTNKHMHAVGLNAGRFAMANSVCRVCQPATSRKLGPQPRRLAVVYSL